MKVEIEEIADRACWEKWIRLKNQRGTFEGWHFVVATILRSPALLFAGALWWMWR